MYCIHQSFKELTPQDTVKIESGKNKIHQSVNCIAILMYSLKFNLESSFSKGDLFSLK